MIDKVRTFLDIRQICNKKILAAVSGGRDSVALLSALCSLRDEYSLTLDVAYINHNLRNDSDDEQRFVTNLVNGLDNVKLHIHVVDKSTWAQCSNIEAKSRQIRYEFFDKVLAENNLDLIATAHHFNDKIETFFINLFRANGIETLASIEPVRQRIIRPLINVTRDEINRYIEDNNLAYIEDYTNRTDDYMRNKIRHKLIPVLNEITPHCFDSFAHIFDFFKENAAFIEECTTQAMEQCIKYSDDDCIIADNAILSSYNVVIKKNIVKRIVYRLDNCAVIALPMFDEILSDGNVNYVKDDLWVISKSNLLYFCRKSRLSEPKTHMITEPNTQFSLGLQNFCLTDDNSTPYLAKFKATVDILPITVRAFSDNDTILVNGHPQLVSRLLSNGKIPRQLHKYAAVLSTGKNIIGVFAFGTFHINSLFHVHDGDNAIFIKKDS